MGQIRVTRIVIASVCVMVFLQELHYVIRYVNPPQADVTHENIRYQFVNAPMELGIESYANLRSYKQDNIQSYDKQKYDFSNSPMGQQFHVSNVNCKKIIDGDLNETINGRYVSVAELPEPDTDLSMYMELKSNCSNFKTHRGYILHHLTEEELNFPLAVSLLLFKDFHQVERLIRTIYRPQNYYCLHVDLSSDPTLHAVVRSFADCFDNVVVSRDVIDIIWGDFTLSEGEFVCMWELLKRKKWKYFINLTGQEFPLKTNRQIMEILKRLNGANDIWTSPMHAQGSRFERRWNINGRPPHRIHIVKGSSHVTFSREFIEFIVSDPRIPDLATFLHKSSFPEESLWATLNNDVTLHAPGGFNGTLVEAINKTWFARVKWWQSMKAGCTGFYKRSICIFGVGDIRRLAHSKQYFANKLYWDYQPVALACLQEWIFNQTRDEYLDRYRFNARVYENLPNVLQMFKPNKHLVE